jgi:hypothetical protein
MSVVVPGLGRDVTIRMQEVAFQPRQQTSEYPYPYFPYANGGGARMTATKEVVVSSPARMPSGTEDMAPPPGSSSSSSSMSATVRPLAAVLSAIESAGSPGMSEESRVEKLCRKLQRSFQEKNMMLSEIQYLKQQLKEVTQSASSTIEAEREAMDQLVESNVRTGVLACVWCIKTQAVKMLALAFHRWKVYEPEEKVEDGEEAFWRLLKDSVRSKLSKAAPSSSSSSGAGGSGGGGASGSPNTQLLRFMHAASKAAGLGEGSMGSFLASLAAGGGPGAPAGPQSGASYGGFRPRFMAQGTKSSQAKAKGAPQPAYQPAASMSASASSGVGAGGSAYSDSGVWGGPRPRPPFGHYNNKPSPAGSPAGRSRSPPTGRYSGGGAPAVPARSPENQVYTALLALAAEKVRSSLATCAASPCLFSPRVFLLYVRNGRSR